MPVEHGVASSAPDPYVFRDCRMEDLAWVQTLNDAEQPHVTGFEPGWPEWYLREAAAFRVAERTVERAMERVPAGFLVGLWPGLAYPSLNYRFFERFYGRAANAFFYVDRLAVMPEERGRGVGRRLYADAARIARRRTSVVCCEVNLRPPNATSLQFHHHLGFREVGRQETEGGKKEVALLALELGGENEDKKA